MFTEAAWHTNKVFTLLKGGGGGAGGSVRRETGKRDWEATASPSPVGRAHAGCVTRQAVGTFFSLQRAPHGGGQGHSHRDMVTEVARQDACEQDSFHQSDWNVTVLRIWKALFCLCPLRGR